MLIIIWEFLRDNFPEMAGYVILIFIISYITIKIYSFYKETKIVCNDHKEMKGQISILIDKFNSLIVALNEKKAISNPELFNTNSPVNLTDQGEKLINIIGWKNILDNEEKKKKLFDFLDKFKLKTQADVERYCIILLDELYNDRGENSFTKVKKYLYNHANIDRQNALFACAINLRGEYLKKHSDIK